MWFLGFLSKIKYKEQPIKTYKNVQTGPKTKLGGLKKGLAKLAYQVGIAETVKTEPIIPAAKQMPRENNNKGQLFTFIVSV